MNYLIDSYAWIEYLRGTDSGKKVREIILENNNIYSINLTISEVISRVKRGEGNVDLAYQAITSNSKVMEINSEIAKKAGLFHSEIRKKIKDFGLVDSLIFVLAKELDAKIVTGDKHFKKFKDVVFLK